MNNRKLFKLNLAKDLAIIFIVLIIFLIYWLFSRSFLYLTVLPTNAVVTVDNAPVTLDQNGKGSEIIKPGNHTIRIDADGFISQVSQNKFLGGMTKKLNFSLNQSPTPIKIAADADFLTSGVLPHTILFLGDSGKTLYQSILSAGTDNFVNFQTLPITNSNLSGIQNIIWSPNRSLALFRKADQVDLFDFQKYDFVHQTEVLWGKNIGDIAWAPDNSKIAYYNLADKTLVFSNISNTDQTRILNFSDYGIDNPLLRWSPDSQYLLVIPRNSDANQNKIYLLNISSKVLSQIADTGNQVDAIFSPDSQKILYLSNSTVPNNPIKFVASIMDRNGDNKKALDLRVNLSDIIWTKNNNLLTVLYDQLSQKDKIYNFDVNNNLPDGSILTFANPINVLIDANSGQDKNPIVAFQSGNLIYAFQN